MVRSQKEITVLFGNFSQMANPPQPQHGQLMLFMSPEGAARARDARK